MFFPLGSSPQFSRKSEPFMVIHSQSWLMWELEFLKAVLEEALIPSASGAARATFEGVGRRIRTIRREK